MNIQAIVFALAVALASISHAMAEPVFVNEVICGAGNYELAVEKFDTAVVA